MPYTDPALARTHISYYAMLSRCYDEKHQAFRNYGGRGITVCERWRNSFRDFVADVGVRPPGLQLDRIDNSGNYEPGNCRWVTPSENSFNRRRTAARIAAGRINMAKAKAASIAAATSKTRCKNGHEFTPENTYVKPGSGTRACKRCKHDRIRLARAARKMLLRAQAITPPRSAR